MPRAKQTAASLENLDAVDNQRIEQSHALHGELQAARSADLAVIDSRFGLDDVSYDYETLVARASGIVGVVSGQMFELGRICILIKEHEGHGRYESALERIGIAPRFAHKCISAVCKFENGGEGRKLLASRLSSSKLLELLSEDDGELDAIAGGGTLAGHTLDEIAAMTVRELREALRKERQENAEEIDARDQIIERKDKKLRSLELNQRRLKKAPLQEQAIALLGDLDGSVTELLAYGEQVKAAIAAITDLYVDAGEMVDETIQLRVQQAADTAGRIVAGIEHLMGA